MSTVYYTYILKIISFQTEKRRTFWINKSYFQNLILLISKWVTLLTSGVRDWREWAGASWCCRGGQLNLYCRHHQHHRHHQQANLIFSCHCLYHHEHSHFKSHHIISLLCRTPADTCVRLMLASVWKPGRFPTPFRFWVTFGIAAIMVIIIMTIVIIVISITILHQNLP